MKKKFRLNILLVLWLWTPTLNAFGREYPRSSFEWSQIKLSFELGRTVWELLANENFYSEMEQKISTAPQNSSPWLTIDAFRNPEIFLDSPWITFYLTKQGLVLTILSFPKLNSRKFCKKLQKNPPRAQKSASDTIISLDVQNQSLSWLEASLLPLTSDL